MRRKRILIAAGATVLLIAIVAASIAVKRKDSRLTEVTTTAVEKVDLTSKVTANGRIEAQRKVDLSAHVMGQIVNLAVREGDRVAKGDFLMQIDKAQLAASTQSAEASVRALLADRDAARANLEEAQRNFQRASKNYDQRIIPLADLERVRTTVESARANVAAVERRIDQARASLTGARDTLSKTTLRAPMAGLVTRLPVEEGEVAVIGTMNNPGTVLMTISDMSVVEAVMEVDETDVPLVKAGQKASVTVDAYPNKTFDGIVREVGSSPITRTGGGTGADAINFEVKIEITNPPEDIRPGFSASADIITGTRTQVPAIPIQALVVREQEGQKGKEKPKEEEGVYLLENGKVKFNLVTTGLAGETQIEIAKGLKPGTQIVTGPFKALREIKDGEKVRVKKEDPKKKDGEKKS